MMHIDYAVSEDCINLYSFGEICVHCGCCSRNPNYMDMIRRRLKYYKELLKEREESLKWYMHSNFESERIKNARRQNVRKSILFCKRQIRLCKKILRTKGKVE